MNCEGDVLLKKRSNFIDLERVQAREGLSVSSLGILGTPKHL